MELLFERVAGLDVGKATVTVCVRTPGPGGRRLNEVRTFSTMTRSLEVLRDWLVERGVTIAAIESTSTYWKGPFYCLEEVLEVWLLNAAHMKAVPGRKTDVKEAEWIAQLLEHGLLRPSFVPPPEIRRLRMLTRYRVQLMGDRTRETTRLEGMLEDASIKLSAVASSLTTVSAQAMLGALIAGERDPRVLAGMAKGRMRVKIPALTEAMIGHFDPGHAQMAGSLLNRLKLVQTAIEELDAVIATACRQWAHQLEVLQTTPRGVKVAQSSSPRPAGTCPGSDPVPDSGQLTGDTINGGPGDDVLYGYGGGDHVSGGVGADPIRGGDGDDNLHGRRVGALPASRGERDGDDEIHEGAGNDFIDGDEGDDFLYGGSSTSVNLVHGGTGDDVLIGELGSFSDQF